MGQSDQVKFLACLKPQELRTVQHAACIVSLDTAANRFESHLSHTMAYMRRDT